MPRCMRFGQFFGPGLGKKVMTKMRSAAAADEDILGGGECLQRVDYEVGSGGQRGALRPSLRPQ